MGIEFGSIGKKEDCRQQGRDIVKDCFCIRYLPKRGASQESMIENEGVGGMCQKNTGNGSCSPWDVGFPVYTHHEDV